MSNPKIEILGDDSLVIVVDSGPRLVLSGPFTRPIVAAYRHLLTHPGTGETDAAHYVWGLVDGLRYATFNEMRSELERTRADLDRLQGRR